MRTRDLNRLAAETVSRSTDETDSPEQKAELRLHAQALGRQGGLKGGPARAQRLSSEQRSEIARKAAQARWRKDDG